MDTTRRKPDTARPLISWTEEGASRSALWRSEAGLAPPARVQVVDDTLTADAAYRLACGGTALLWRGDFQNARQLLQAMARRIESHARRPHKAKAPGEAPRPMAEAFHLQRMAQAQRSFEGKRQAHQRAVIIKIFQRRENMQIRDYARYSGEALQQTNKGFLNFQLNPRPQISD